MKHLVMQWIVHPTGVDRSQVKKETLARGKTYSGPLLVFLTPLLTRTELWAMHLRHASPTIRVVTERVG